MVLSTSTDNVQELWVHKQLDADVVSHLVHLLADEANRKRLHAEYLSLHKEVKAYTGCATLEEFFASIYKWEAHYYLPMFVIEALHTLVLEHVPEEELFFLSTYNIPSLLELAAQELASGRPVEEVHKEYAFLNCHQVDAQGFTIDEIAELTPQEKASEDDKYNQLYNSHIQDTPHEPLFNTLREWIRIRNQEMEYLYKVYYETRALFEQEAEKRGITLAEVWNLSTQTLLRKSALKPSNAIARINGETTFFHVDSVNRKSSTKTELVGKTVYGKGKLEGVVLKAFHPEDVKPHPHGKPLILVSGMTTPDFIPVLKKHCAALVTDEGGILCHAAIVARELNLPCIVGTGLATERLETGQEICLDFTTSNITNI